VLDRVCGDASRDSAVLGRRGARARRASGATSDTAGSVQQSITPALHTPQGFATKARARSIQGVLVAVVEVLHPSTHRRTLSCTGGGEVLLTCRRG